MKLRDVATGFDQLEKVFQDEWFDVYQMPHGIYAIHEPYHIQNVISYLVEGSERVLLFDTGAGIGDINQVVDRITDKDLVVVNSHAHFDHVGGNHQFPEVHIHQTNNSLVNLRKGYSIEEMRPQMDPEILFRELPNGVNLDSFCVKPSKPVAIVNGHRFDLGDRVLEGIHAPGHAPDCIALFDEAARLMLTADVVYNGPIYAHFEGSFYGDSSLEGYIKSLRMLSGYDDRVDQIFVAHGEPILKPAAFGIVADALEAIVLHEAAKCFLVEKRDDFLDASLPVPGERVPSTYPSFDKIYCYQFAGGYDGGGFVVYTHVAPN